MHCFMNLRQTLFSYKERARCLLRLVRYKLIIFISEYLLENNKKCCLVELKGLVVKGAYSTNFGKVVNKILRICPVFHAP